EHVLQHIPWTGHFYGSLSRDTATRGHSPCSACFAACSPHQQPGRNSKVGVANSGIVRVRVLAVLNIRAADHPVSARPIFERNSRRPATDQGGAVFDRRPANLRYRDAGWPVSLARNAGFPTGRRTAKVSSGSRHSRVAGIEPVLFPAIHFL